MNNYKCKVSIIIPIGNPEALKKLFVQYLNSAVFEFKRRCSKHVEVIFVNNSDVKFEIADLGCSFRYRIITASGKRSPYYAKNIGYCYSNGEIISFLDTSCHVNPFWLVALTEAVTLRPDVVHVGPYFIEVQADNQIWGNVYRINFPDVAEEVIKGGAPGGNVSMSRETFSRVGKFFENRSGGDTLWFSRARNKGVSVACHSAMGVRLFAKRRNNVLRQALRLGAGATYIHRHTGKSLYWIGLSILYNFLPKPFYYYKKIRKINDTNILSKILLIFACYFYDVICCFGRLNFSKVFGLKAD